METHKVILAADPGVSTGIAVKNNNMYFTCTLSEEDIDNGKLRDLISKSDIIIFEDFMGYKSHGMKVSAAGFFTVRLIGKIQEQCNANNKEIIRRLPQNRIAFLTKAKQMLKSGKVACIRPTRHEADALAHLLSFEYFAEREARLAAK